MSGDCAKKAQRCSARSAYERGGGAARKRRLVGSRVGAGRLRAAALAILLGAWPGALPNTLGDEAGRGEYEVKAAFLYHFAQFVEWPPETFKDAKSPLMYCTIGGDSFHGALDETLKGKSVGSHPLQVQHLKEREQTAGCQILFIGAEEKKHQVEDLASTNGHPVLTVGETDFFAKDGGIIGFLVENNKVRFEINVQSAGRAKIKISARLLLLAKTVIGNES